MKLIVLAVLLISMLGCQAEESGYEAELGQYQVLASVTQAAGIALSPPSLTRASSLEAALSRRGSHRDFVNRPITKEALSQMLWALQGEAVDALTGATRTTPSAGATHPLTVYVVVSRVTGLEPGIYVYLQNNHTLRLKLRGNFATNLTAAALHQDFISQVPVNFVLVADYRRTTGRYGERGRRYVYMEIGHATQNLLLQAEGLGLGTVAVGAFHDQRVAEILGTQLAPLMIVPTGYTR